MALARVRRSGDFASGAGLAVGVGTAMAIRALVPGLPVHTPVEFVFAALGVSLMTGLLSGILPARRAAALEPVDALRTE